MNETISMLLADIRGLQDTILYCENRILRKQIAIEEIIQNRPIKVELPPAEKAKPTDAAIVPNPKPRSRLCTEILAVFNEDPLTTGHVQKLFPEDDAKKVNSALKYLSNTGRLRNTSWGVYEKIVVCASLALVCIGCTTQRPTLRSANMPPLPFAVLKADAKQSVPLVTHAGEAAIILPPKPITLAWNCGYKVEAYEFTILPRTSGIESTQDFVHWFAETNLPINQMFQECRYTFTPSATYGFYRAVDHY